MGWCSGGELFTSVWDIVRPRIREEHRLDVCRKLVDAFEDHDADTLFDGCEGKEMLTIAKERGYDDE